MHVKIFLVDKIIHYTPLYIALDKVIRTSNKTSFQVEFFSLESDLELLKKLVSEEDDPESISLYLTSLPEIKHRISNDNSFGENTLDLLYNNCVLWMLLIDRTPLSVIGSTKTSQKKFDTHWQPSLNKKSVKRPKIACYPEGSTVDWFIHQSFNYFKAFDVVRVPFGRDAEFEAIANGTCDYAVTLEPWRLQENQHVLHDIPIGPFGFTGVVSRKWHFDHPGKREFLLQIAKTTTNEIANLYRTFEQPIFDWEMFENWDQTAENAILEKESDQIQIAQFLSNQLEISISCEALRWMSSHRIWAMDPLLPHGENDAHFKSAAELTTELLAEKEKDNQIQLAGVHTIHHLKNELRNKVSLPLGKYIEELAKKSENAREDFRLGDLEKAKNHVDELSDKFKKWLNALNYKLNREEGSFSFSTFEMETYLKKLKQIHNLKQDIGFELRGISPKPDGYLLDRANVPSVLMELMLDEIIGNAVGAYQAMQEMINSGVFSQELLPFDLKVIWERVNTIHGTMVQIQIENTGTYIPAEKIPVLGKIPTKSGTDGSGFGLHFLNIALQIFDCALVDTVFSRYFLPENLSGAAGNESVRFTFLFPAKVI